MAVYRDSSGSEPRWRYRKWVGKPDGTRERISGTPATNTKVAAEAAERAHIDRVLNPPAVPVRKEGITFNDWFNGRYWREWIVARKNSSGEKVNKRSIYKYHLEPYFGPMLLETIRAPQINEFKAQLVEKESLTSDRSRNNILCVLSSALKYAEEAEVLDEAPKIRLFKYEAPQMEWWSFDEYKRLDDAAAEESPAWHVAFALAGEAGLRAGEIRALRWREDVDLDGKVIAVNRQFRRGEEQPPKWGTKRKIPMTAHLHAVLKRLEVVREGLVVFTKGEAITESEMRWALRRICRRARLPERQWHALRHSFGTHAALCGVNPWRLQAWMGHKAVTTTMHYVHVASNYVQPLPERVSAAAKDGNPDVRILAMLGARAGGVWPRGGQEKAA